MEEGVVAAGGQLARHGVLSAEPAESPPVVEVGRGGRRGGGEPGGPADPGSAAEGQERLSRVRDAGAAVPGKERRGGIVAAAEGAVQAAGERSRRRDRVMEGVGGGEEGIGVQFLL